MRAAICLMALGLASIGPACSGSSESDDGSGGTSGAAGNAGTGSSAGSSGTAGTSGSAGSGGTSGSAGSAGASGAGGSAGSVGDGGLCATLQETRRKTLEDASSCSGVLTVVQCSGSASVPDQCACPVIVNEARPEKVKAAQDAYDAWVKAGCGPFPCGAACFAGTKGKCDSVSGTCQWE